VALAVALSVLIGLALGLLGGGGSILAVPILTYAVGLEPREAIATSLLIVGTTSAFALVPHARSGNVAWRTGLLFGATAMAGAYLGGRAAGWFSGSTLLLLFAAMMVATAVGMFRGRGTPARRSEGGSLPVTLVIVEGLIVGAATGLVGAGGGFLVVPALVLLGGMDMHRAIGTSLLVIALKSFAAFAGHAADVSVDFELAAAVTAGAVVGALAGAKLASRVPEGALRRGFGVFVLVMAGYIVWRETGATLAAWVLGNAWLTALSCVTLASLGLAALARMPEPQRAGP